MLILGGGGCAQKQKCGYMLNYSQIKWPEDLEVTAADPGTS